MPNDYTYSKKLDFYTLLISVGIAAIVVFGTWVLSLYH